MKPAPILNERPEGMSLDEYKFIRKQQQKEIKKYLKGEHVFISKDLKFKDNKGKVVKGRTAERIPEIKK